MGLQRLNFEYLGKSFEVSPGMVWFGQCWQHVEPQWLLYAEDYATKQRRNFVLRLCRFDRMAGREQ